MKQSVPVHDSLRALSLRVACLLGALMLLGCQADDPAEKVCDQTLASGACAGVSRPLLCQGEFCTDGVSCARTLRVRASAAAGGDGSEGRPYSTLEAAAAIAASGDCIALASGTYVGASLAGGVSVLGKGAAEVTIAASSTVAASGCQNGAARYALCMGLKSTGSPGQKSVLRGVTLSGEARGLLVQGVDGLRIEEVRIDGVRELGIGAGKGSALELEQVTVRGIRGGASASAGLGILLVDGSRIEGRGVLIEKSAGPGVIAAESALVLSGSLVTDSGSYGVTLDCTKDAGCQNGLASRLTEVAITGSAGVGLLVRGNKLSATGLDIGGTRLGSGLARGADIQAGAVLNLSQSRIHENAGQGLVLDGSSGKLDRNQIENNEERGLWVQNAAASLRLVLDANEIVGNKLVGLGSTGCLGLSVTGGHVSGTRKAFLLVGAGHEEVGDGLQVLQGSAVEAQGITVEANGRAGVLVDAAKMKLRDSTLGGDSPLILQNASSGEQTFEGNRTSAGAPIQAVSPKAPFYVNPKPVDLVGVHPVPIP